MVNYGEVGRPKKIQGDVDASYQSQIGLEVAVGREAESSLGTGSCEGKKAQNVSALVL